MPLRRVLRVGFGVLLLQFIVACCWSVLLTNRFSETNDIATYAQALDLISRGDLNPTLSVQHFHFYQDHGEFLFWLLAIPNLFTHSLLVLLWPQNAAIVGAEAIAFTWMCETVAHRRVADRSVALAVALPVLGLLVLVVNPWIWWTVSFDVHTEPFSVFFAIGAARNLCQHRGRTWMWVLPGLLTGDLGCTYLLAVGLSAAISGRYALRRGLAVAAASLFWLGVLTVIHANKGDAIAQFSYLSSGHFGPAGHKVSVGSLLEGSALHPNRVINDLWRHRTNIWANASPGGLIGWLWPPTLIPSLLAIAESQLGNGNGFAAPFFQEFLLYIFGPVGTVGLLALGASKVRGSKPWRLWLLVLLVGANAIAWALVWIPDTPNRWLNISPKTAAVLSRVERMIKPDDEVVTGNGIIGRFAARRYAYSTQSSNLIVPVKARTIWIVLVPRQGIEVARPAAEMSHIARLIHLKGAHLIVHTAGVYAIKWVPPHGTHSLVERASGNTGSLPGWLVPGQSSRVIADPQTRWYVQSTARPGYVVDHDYWRETRGTYEASVTLSTTGPARVELWNADANRLLARDDLNGSDGVVTVSLSTTLDHLAPPTTYTGWGIWRDAPLQLPGNNLEIRVWSPGGADEVNVYRVTMSRTKRT